MMNPVVAQSYNVTVDQGSAPSNEATTQATSDNQTYSFDVDISENKAS